MPYTLSPLPNGALVVGVIYGDITYQDFIVGFDAALASGRYSPGMDTVNVFLPGARSAPVSFHAMLRMQERVRAAETAGRETMGFRAAIVANDASTRAIAEAYAALWSDQPDVDVKFHVSNDLASALEWLGHGNDVLAVSATIAAIAQDPSGPNLAPAEAKATAEALAASPAA